MYKQDSILCFLQVRLATTLFIVTMALNQYLRWTLISTLILSISAEGSMSSDRTFSIDPSRKTFLLDGKPFRYVSGSIHYFRVHQDLWDDRLRKIRAAGFNAIQFYVEWSLHEPEEGKYVFEGLANVEEFLRLAQKNDLLVLLRPGPYIDAERDMGGLPPWLLRKNPNVAALRSSDPTFLQSVEKWYEVLLSRLKPFTHRNGGPIIMVQVENEYGSYVQQTGRYDGKYLAHLRDTTRRILGAEVFLYSTDGADNYSVKWGRVGGVYSTVDFGVTKDVAEKFSHQRYFEPNGPMVNSEFYPGWLDHWGEPHNTVEGSKVAATLDAMLAMGANVNVYMLHGGTSFGFTAGANEPFVPNPTSYDYDAPISEAGDLTEKYFLLKKVIGKYLPIPEIAVNATAAKGSYGKIVLKPVGGVIENLEYLLEGGSAVKNKVPLSFEALGQNYGFVMYETTVDHLPPDPVQLTVMGIRDRGYVFVDDSFRGVLTRTQSVTSLSVRRKGQKLRIVVENQGRICFGKSINDFKGIISNVTLGTRTLLDWTMYKIPLTNVTLISKLKRDPRIRKMSQSSSAMSFWKGELKTPCDQQAPLDTFLSMDNERWTKGVIFVNGFNLGRYWPRMGPQETLYLPAVLLKGHCKTNRILLLEQDEVLCKQQQGGEKGDEASCYISSVPAPNLSGPVPDSVASIDVEDLDRIDEEDVDMLQVEVS